MLLRKIKIWCIRSAKIKNVKAKWNRICILICWYCDYIINSKCKICIFLCHLSRFRYLLDRASTDHDHILRQIDPEMLSSPSSPAAFSSDDSWTISSNKDFTNRLSLSEILSNIKACRLRHFQPRITQLQDSDNRCTSKKLGQNVNKRRIPMSSILSSSTMITSRNRISGKIFIYSSLSSAPNIPLSHCVTWCIYFLFGNAWAVLAILTMLFN